LPLHMASSSSSSMSMRTSEADMWMKPCAGMQSCKQACASRKPPTTDQLPLQIGQQQQQHEDRNQGDLQLWIQIC
jgi:hypothetical protein